MMTIRGLKLAGLPINEATVTSVAYTGSQQEESDEDVMPVDVSLTPRTTPARRSRPVDYNEDAAFDRILRTPYTPPKRQRAREEPAATTATAAATTTATAAATTTATAAAAATAIDWSGPKYRVPSWLFKMSGGKPQMDPADEKELVRVGNMSERKQEAYWANEARLPPPRSQSHAGAPTVKNTNARGGLLPFVRFITLAAAFALYNFNFVYKAMIAFFLSEVRKFGGCVNLPS